MFSRGTERIYQSHIAAAEAKREHSQYTETERKMAGKISMAAIFVVLAAISFQNTFAVTYTVGDSNGWIVPTTNDDFYDEWGDNKDFVVGDILVFNFTTGRHDVAEVKEDDYDSCIITNTIFNKSNGPARITLSRTGDHYFVCTFPRHCSAGQKLKVEVRTVSPAPTGVISPAPPGVISQNSASSFVATFSFVFMFIGFLL